MDEHKKMDCTAVDIDCFKAGVLRIPYLPLQKSTQFSLSLCHYAWNGERLEHGAK